jgi:SDR family mycofactocin-dependent oxidoreductase
MDGKVALVTGAAHGQGRSHAVRLAEEGADIIAVDICEQIDSVPYAMATWEELEETGNMVEDLDRRIVIRKADVRDKAALDQAVTAGVEELGKLDTVVANAGIWSQGPILEVEDQTYYDIIAVLQHGVFFTCQVTIPHLIKAGGGSIVITSSTAGLMGFPYLSPYTMGKHAVIGLMRSLAGELGEHMIRVNCVLPTSTLTPMINNEYMWKTFSPEVEEPKLKDFGDQLQAWHMLPVPYNDPVDISNAVLYLASDEARHVTAVALPVDAGFLEKI